MIDRSDLRIRDPYIIEFDDRYLLFGTTDRSPWVGPGTGFDRYESTDLTRWSGPFPAFRPDEGFWGTTQFWAPEVHQFDQAWYMFATFADQSGHRGTQVLRAESPDTAFRPWSDRAVTPAAWMCLDGTFYQDSSGVPWIIFCHEWLQAGEGAIYAQRLNSDLRSTIAEPMLLFRASDAPWARPFRNPDTGYDTHAYITDGPYMLEDESGLAMLWSSGGDRGYSVGVARSVSAGIEGPWVHQQEALVNCDGGHAMRFRTSEEDFLVFHQPNDLHNERLSIQPVDLVNGQYRLAPRAGTPWS